MPSSAVTCPNLREHLLPASAFVKLRATSLFRTVVELRRTHLGLFPRYASSSLAGKLVLSSCIQLPCLYSWKVFALNLKKIRCFRKAASVKARWTVCPEDYPSLRWPCSHTFPMVDVESRLPSRGLILESRLVDASLFPANLQQPGWGFCEAQARGALGRKPFYDRRLSKAISLVKQVTSH